TEGVDSLSASCCPGAWPSWLFGFGAATPATSPPASTPATSTAPIETYQRIAALPSTGGNGDTQIVPRKGRTSSVLHIWVSRQMADGYHAALEEADSAEPHPQGGLNKWSLHRDKCGVRQAG